MGKELVISANRHETKVAVLEDDQLVEIYFQRANEYSLAGSIHKGRVTRVLPGMQSAFVDLGLERDTFLYVSDFFEEHDEYDQLTAVEIRGKQTDERTKATAERPERENAFAGQPGPTPERLAAAQTVAYATAEKAAPTAAPSTPAQGAEKAEEGEGRERRGRRSRRRRGRSRGFPESKYAAGPEQAEGDAETGAEEAAVEEDFLVLPGESLAKYRRAEPQEAKPQEAEPQGSEPQEAGPQEAVEAGETTESAAAAAPESTGEVITEDLEAESVQAAAEEIETSEPVTDRTEEEEEDRLVTEVLNRVEGEAEAAGPSEPEETPLAEAVEATGVVEEASAVETAESETSEATQPSEVAAAEEAATGEEGSAAEEPAGEGEAIAEMAREALEQQLQATEEEMAIAEEAASGEEASPGEEPGQDSQVEGPEPARTPQSLTATLREQAGRYPHRVSRRMRRRRAAESQHQAEGQSQAETAVKEKVVTRPEKTTTPSITDLLKEGQEILVQIAKEPLGQKGARITSHIALPGRYVVYMPTVEHLGVSRKISSEEERQRLKKILQTHRVGIPGGFIMRTAGEGKSEEEIASDMTFLFNLWLDIRQKAEKRSAPALIHHDLELVQRILRDQLTESFKAIWADNEEVYESVLRFVQRFQPALVSRVKMYTRSVPIFDAFNITQELEKALRPKVWLKSGGYIVINQTEALVAIDVNTGKYVGKSNRLEDTIVKTNTEAVREIVRQIRLRDLGGIIVVDFIDMDERKNRQKVMQALEEAMRADRAPYKILQFNDFGLVAITRKRVKQSLERTLCSPCPYCEGAGYVKSVQTVVGEILQEAVKLAPAVEGSECMLRVNPEVAKLLKSTENKYLEELEGILGRPVMVVSDPNLHQEKFDLA